MGKVIKISIIIIISLAVGAGLGYALGFYNEHSVLVKNLATIYPLRENNSSYTFINPLLAYIIPPASENKKLSLLKDQIASFIESEKKNGLVGWF